MLVIATSQNVANETMVKPRVLIVEDDRALSDILFYNLQKEGFNTFRAFDGREALEQARLKEPDIVILDVMLPGSMASKFVGRFASTRQQAAQGY